MLYQFWMRIPFPISRLHSKKSALVAAWSDERFTKWILKEEFCVGVVKRTQRAYFKRMHFLFLQELTSSICKEVIRLIGYRESAPEHPRVSIKWGNIRKKDNVDFLLVSYKTNLSSCCKNLEFYVWNENVINSIENNFAEFSDAFFLYLTTTNV